jgi:hypothetical protein
MNDTQLQTEDQPTVTGNLYLYETRNYAVIDNTVYEGFNCNGYTFVMKEYTCKSSLNGEVIPESTVYNTKTCQPLWIARFDDAKNACDNLQVKFDSDVKIAVDNHVAEVDETTDRPSLDSSSGQRTAQLNDILINQLEPLVNDIINEFSGSILSDELDQLLDRLSVLLDDGTIPPKRFRSMN